MGIDYLQSNLAGGELAPQLHARSDLEKYSTSVASAKNMVIVPQGGLRRRPGLANTKSDYYKEPVRIEPFVFNQTQKYIIIFRPGFIDIVRDGVTIKRDIPLALTTKEEIDTADIIQSADTLILTHEKHNPLKLVRGATDTDWTASDIALQIPPFNFDNIAPTFTVTGSTQTEDIAVDDIVKDSQELYKALVAQTAIDLNIEDYSNATNWVNISEPVWSDVRGWPAVCTFYGGRLYLAGSTQKPTSVWGSKVNGFFDFTWVENNGLIPADHAIFDTIETNEYNKIINIFNGRNLQVFTTAAEFINTTDNPTPADSSWQKQTGYGSKRLRPIMIDGATLYVDSSERTIRQFVFDFNEDAFVSNNITLLASHLLSDVVSMSAIKGTTVDVSDYMYCINRDGSIAILNTLRSEGVLGWTHWETQGEFIEACVIGKEVYFVVKRLDSYFIEKLEERTYTDHNTIIKGVKPETLNIISSPHNIIDLSDNIVDTDHTTGTPVTSITTNYKDLFLQQDFKVIADFSMMPDSKPIVDGTDLNHFTITRDAYRLEVGLDFQTKITMLPIATALNSGATLHKRKRVVKVDLNIMESLGVYVENIYSADKRFTVILDEAPEKFTGFKEIYLLGYNRLYQFEVTQDNPLPLLIRAIGYEIVY